VPYYAYRIIKTPSANEEQFKSQAALLKPRPSTLPVTNPDPWDSCSVFATYDAAVAQARRRPSLGRFIAELFFLDGAHVTRDSANATGHFNIWGDPAELLRYVRSVTPIP
jgi:hypothetical protein